MQINNNFIKLIFFLRFNMTQYQLPFETIKRKILTKKEAKTSNKLGCKPEKRKTEEFGGEKW